MCVCVSVCVLVHRNTVDEWMGHYREVIGISVPAHLRSALSRSPSPSSTGILPPAQRLHSSRSYTGQLNNSSEHSSIWYNRDKHGPLQYIISLCL